MTKSSGADLVQRLHEMIAGVMKENRSLKRQVLKMTERKSAGASTAVKRGRRTVQRRVQRASPAPKRKLRKPKPKAKAAARRKPAAKAPARRKPATRRRRKGA